MPTPQIRWSTIHPRVYYHGMDGFYRVDGVPALTWVTELSAVAWAVERDRQSAMQLADEMRLLDPDAGVF